VGELMARSHWGQRAAGLGELHGDQLAERVAAAGPAAGLFGTRAPAAASGATLVVLGRADAEPALRDIADAYAAERGLPVALFGGSSSGCSPAGTREI
jgi:galactokinase